MNKQHLISISMLDSTAKCFKPDEEEQQEE